MVIFDLAPLSHWRQKRHAAQVAITQGLARNRLRLMLIIELQRAQQQRDELLTLLQQRIDEAKSRNTAAKANGVPFDVALEFGRYAAYSDVKWLIDAQRTVDNAR